MDRAQNRLSKATSFFLQKLRNQQLLVHPLSAPKCGVQEEIPVERSRGEVPWEGQQDSIRLGRKESSWAQQ